MANCSLWSDYIHERCRDCERCDEVDSMDEEEEE